MRERKQRDGVRRLIFEAFAARATARSGSARLAQDLKDELRELRGDGDDLVNGSEHKHTVPIPKHGPEK
jgi:hypothetical protein